MPRLKRKSYDQRLRDQRQQKAARRLAFKLECAAMGATDAETSRLYKESEIERRQRNREANAEARSLKKRDEAYSVLEQAANTEALRRERSSARLKKLIDQRRMMENYFQRPLEDQKDDVAYTNTHPDLMLTTGMEPISVATKDDPTQSNFQTVESANNEPDSYHSDHFNGDFIRRRGFVGHLQPICEETFFGVTFIRTLTRRSKSRYRYECSICKVQFKKRKLAERHGPDHTEARPFECTKCSRKFSTQLKLSSHMRSSIHRPIDLHSPCRKCAVMFRRRGDLRRRGREALLNGDEDSGEPYLCSECGQISVVPSKLSLEIGKVDARCSQMENQILILPGNEQDLDLEVDIKPEPDELSQAEEAEPVDPFLTEFDIKPEVEEPEDWPLEPPQDPFQLDVDVKPDPNLLEPPTDQSQTWICESCSKVFPQFLALQVHFLQGRCSSAPAETQSTLFLN